MFAQSEIWLTFCWSVRCSGSTFKQFKFVYQIINILCGDDMYFCILSAHIKTNERLKRLKGILNKLLTQAKYFYLYRVVSHLYFQNVFILSGIKYISGVLRMYLFENGWKRS